MPSRVPGATGLIEMEPTSSLLNPFSEEGEDGDCAGELIRIARGCNDYEDPIDCAADVLLLADAEQLAKELEAEYAAVRAAIRRAQNSSAAKR